LLTWEVEGSLYTPPTDADGLSDYLVRVSSEQYLQRQLGGWLKHWKPLFPSCLWSAINGSLTSQVDSIFRHGAHLALMAKLGDEIEELIQGLIQLRARLGEDDDDTDATMGPEFHRRASYLDDVVQQQSSLLDWYRSTSFVLTGHTACVKRMGEFAFPATQTLQASVFGEEEQLRENISPFFAQLTSSDGTQVVAPAWGVLMAWVEAGGLTDWLPRVRNGFFMLSAATLPYATLICNFAMQLCC
jgi:hypothetical protein